MMSSLLKNLGDAVLLSEQELMKLIRSAPRRYKVYRIPKRTPGQFRVIAQPAKEVKALQYWIIENFLNEFSVHSAATAYRRGQSIATNASPHVNGRFLLKLDFQDFFPSLKASDFSMFLVRKRAGIEEADVAALTRILFWRPDEAHGLCLSIGAPSSPLVSNLLLYEFDERVSSFCERHGVTYTRYADDLSFSAGESIRLQRAERFVSAVCRLRSPRLTINVEKTVRVSKKRARKITGLVITNDAKVSLGRDRKREISAAVHHFTLGRLNPEECLELKGMLAYVNSVEPDFLVRLRTKYGAEIVRQIQSFR